MTAKPRYRVHKVESNAHGTYLLCFKGRLPEVVATAVKNLDHSTQWGDVTCRTCKQRLKRRQAFETKLAGLG